jgi:hypothetical protein
MVLLVKSIALNGRLTVLINIRIRFTCDLPVHLPHERVDYLGDSDAFHTLMAIWTVLVKKSIIAWRTWNTLVNIDVIFVSHVDWVRIPKQDNAGNVESVRSMCKDRIDPHK